MKTTKKATKKTKSKPAVITMLGGVIKDLTSVKVTKEEHAAIVESSKESLIAIYENLLFIINCKSKKVSKAERAEAGLLYLDLKQWETGPVTRKDIGMALGIEPSQVNYHEIMAFRNMRRSDQYAAMKSLFGNNLTKGDSI